jgi:hypothetical protein
LIVVLVFAVLAGCRSGDGQGSLSQGDGKATSCFPKRGGTRFILGSDALVNTGRIPITIDAVELTGASNMVENGAFVSAVPSHGPSTLVGNVTGMPWSFYAKGQEALWRSRVRAANAVVSPTSSGTDLNLLVVGEAPVASKSSAAGIEVRYHDTSGDFVWHSIVTYRAVPRRSC